MTHFLQSLLLDGRDPDYVPMTEAERRRKPPPSKCYSCGVRYLPSGERATFVVRDGNDVKLGCRACGRNCEVKDG